MTHKLDPLPYDKSALEPHIDARTMAIHHDKHHQAYVNNLNSALEGYEELADKNVMALLSNLDDVPEEIRTAVRNNGGGHANHTTFWRSMSGTGGGEPSGKLAEAMDEAFGSFEEFQAAFKKAAMTRFGSGWAWLCADSDGKLLVTSTANQDNPISEGLIPLLGLDVWEHAYYLNYQNRRGDYVDAWWNVVSWGFVSGNYTAVRVERGIRNVVNWFEETFFKSDDD